MREFIRRSMREGLKRSSLKNRRTKMDLQIENYLSSRRVGHFHVVILHKLTNNISCTYMDFSIKVIWKKFCSAKLLLDQTKIYSKLSKIIVPWLAALMALHAKRQWSQICQSFLEVRVPNSQLYLKDIS